MSRARDVASLLNTVATDTELSSEVSTLNSRINEVPTGGKNLLYNGAMQVAQRGTSSTGIAGNGYFTADRFSVNYVSLGTWTQTVENDAPTGSGFRKSLKMLCTTADAAPAAGDILNIAQPLEGQDLQRIRKGTSDAKAMTLSFWVKSNVTGIYTILVYDNDNNRGTSFSYNISASATWEKKSILIPADTTGVFDNDNSASMTLFWCIGAGSNYTGGTLASAWETYTNANRAVGQTNLAAATSNYWQVTGVQLEVGDTATEFEHKSFIQELRECQRYYEKSYNQEVYPGTASTNGAFAVGSSWNSGAITGTWTIPYKVEKRTSVTFTYYSTNSGTAGVVYNRSGGSFSDRGSGLGGYSGGTSAFVTSIGSGVGIGTYLPTDDSSIFFHWTADAEL